MLPGILGTVHINNREPLSKTAALCFILSKKSFCGKMISEVFAGLFQKAADSKGRAFGRVPPDAKSFAFIRIRKGDATARWAVASWETLSRGFPMRRLTPHLVNLLSANQFFDTLRRLCRRLSYDSFHCFKERISIHFDEIIQRRLAADSLRKPAPFPVGNP